MTTATMSRDIEMPSVWNAFGYALGFHVLMFLWNPTILTGGSVHLPPILMQVEFRDRLPETVKPPQAVKKIEQPRTVKKARKSGLSMSRPQRNTVAIRHPKPARKLAAPPAPRTRVSQVKIPKFVPRASDEDSLAMMNHPKKLATTTALRPATNPFGSPTPLRSKTRGLRASDIRFQVADRGTINPGGHVVNIPIGDVSGETASIATSPELHDAPKGLKHISGRAYQATLGGGVGELAGKNRSGYHGTVQVTGAVPSDEEVFSAGNARGGAISGKGFELGGPIGDRRILRRHLPEYPSWAEEKGISAMVKIFFTVNPDGSIRPSMRIVRSSGYVQLDDLAKQALKIWKFSPTSANSAEEQAWGVITFRFTLA